MSKKIKIKIKKPWIAYPGTPCQQGYAEDLEHGYLLWDFKDDKTFDIEFRKLPNPKPYITINWEGSFEQTIKQLEQYDNLNEARFRVKSSTKIITNDSLRLKEFLKQKYSATEITYKNDYSTVEQAKIKSGLNSFAKDDLRKPDVLFKLIKDYYTETDVSDKEWKVVYSLLKKYLMLIVASSSPKNLNWTIRRLEFDNLFGYGKNNVINFDNVNGIAGLFGPNKIGKSSIPGIIMYSLFNSTDRGAIKNKDIVNIRKSYGFSRIVFSVSGVDYVLERSTKKQTNKKGEISAPTELQLYKVGADSELIRLTGEQRNGTEKLLRELIGTSDDFLLTSLSSQDGAKLFLEQGSTKRLQILSRFFDTDILRKLHDLASDDVKQYKASLKLLKNIDFVEEMSKKKILINESDVSIKTLTENLHAGNTEVQQLRTTLAMHHGTTPVTCGDVERQNEIVLKLQSNIENHTVSLNNTTNEINDLSDKLEKISDIIQNYDLESMKSDYIEQQKLFKTINDLNAIYELELATLGRNKKTLKILDEVPCEDSFPSCKFIKNAHQTKLVLNAQKDKVSAALESVVLAKKITENIDIKKQKSNIDKVEKLTQKKHELSLKESNSQNILDRLNNGLVKLQNELISASSRHNELTIAYKNDENEEIVSIRDKIEKLTSKLTICDNEKTSAITTKAKAQSDLEKITGDRTKRIDILQKMKAHEVITTSFSKKGIPNEIISSILPVVNEEIDKLMGSIFNFTVELEKEPETDHVEIMLNYGDSKRIVELGCGYEKLISSLVLRVALMNSSSLPKSDILIIDEGFGALDPQGIEEVNRMIKMVSEYYKSVILITHVEEIKETADTIFEISKVEKDAKIIYE